jgi:hypothetical protein
MSSRQLAGRTAHVLDPGHAHGQAMYLCAKYDTTGSTMHQLRGPGLGLYGLRRSPIFDPIPPEPAQLLKKSSRAALDEIPA